MENSQNNNSMYDNLSDKGKIIILDGVLTGIENEISYLNKKIKNIELNNSELKDVCKGVKDILSTCKEEVINELKQALINCNSCLNEDSTNNNENYELLETIKQLKQYDPKFTCDLNEDCDWILETTKLFGIQFVAKNYIYCNEFKFFYQNNLLSTLKEILKINSFSYGN